MNIAVRYHSRSGNTKKIAEAIAASVNTTAKTSDQSLTEPVDILFIGGALYAGSIDAHLKSFIQTLTPQTVKTIVPFSTSAALKPIRPQIAELLKTKDIIIVEEEFMCKGKFLFTNKGKPNEQDCADAAAFAKKMINQSQS